MRDSTERVTLLLAYTVCVVALLPLVSDFVRMILSFVSWLIAHGSPVPGTLG